jgi:hypothetical protein
MNLHRGPLGPVPELYTQALRTVPSWTREKGALFAWEKIVWRVESIGSHNNTPERGHICWCNLKAPRDPETGEWSCVCPPRLSMWVEYANALPANQSPGAPLPKAPCTTCDVAESISRYLHSVRRFTPDVLAKVIRIL